jgi:hypothetical protein
MLMPLQAEAAAKLQRYRLGVQQQLAAITAAAQAGSGVAPDLLFVLAEQLFASPINLSEFVLLGGLPVVLAAMQSLAAQLSRQQHPELQTLKALLQACWVVLQLAHGPPACKTALEEPHVVAVLLSTSQAVAQLPSTHAPATESILRNLWWTLLLLCDPRAAPRRAAFAAGEQQHPVLQQVLAQDGADGVVSHLQQLVALQHGPSAGWLAAAQMGLVLQLGHESQQRQQQGQQQQQEPASVARAASAVVRAMLQPDSLAGLGFLLQGREQHARQYGSVLLVEGLVHYLLTFHAPELLRLLVEGQLVGSFAAGCSLKLGRLLVCQLLSSQGQAVLAAVEEEYELDVPLALAQVIPLKLHIKLPPAPRQQQQHEAAGGGEIQPAAAATSTEQQEEEEQQQTSVQAAMADDTFTDAMACRLLLQHGRLQELLGAFCEEVRATQQQQPRAAGCASAAHQQDEEQQQPSLVMASSLALVQHLMTRDLQLHTVQHKLGDSVAASVSSASSRNSSIDAALAMPDSTGVYSSVLAGMVPADQLPAAAYRNGSSCSGGSTDALLTLPPPPPGMVMAAQQQQVVMFQFGLLQHAVDAATYCQIKGSSSLVRSILRQAGDSSSSSPAAQQQQRVVRVLSIPHFTDAANCWLVRCLERWLQTRALEGFTPQQAAKLWVAADFLQVNDLQVACEDVMLAACEATPAFMDVVVELCARHSEPSARLLRLMMQQLLRRAGAAAATGPGDGGGYAAQAQAAAGSQPRVQLLRRLLAQLPGLLLPVMHAELRDRLLTLCIQNANLDADCPDEAVE